MESAFENMKSIIIFVTTLSILINFSNGVVDYKFPESFKFATATSAYQIEGGWDADGKGPSVWDYITHNYPSKVNNSDNGDIACDSYHKYKEDVQLLKNLGVDLYRFSISWSRILPNGTIHNVNQAGIDYYKNLIEELKNNGISPMVTLFHWDLPMELDDLGGWMNPDMIEYYADYSRLIFENFAKDVPFWITFNEPFQICNTQYGVGTLTPGVIASGTADYICAHNLLKSHARVYHMYDEEFRKLSENGKITLSLDTYWFEPASDSPEDIEAAERALQFLMGWFAHAIYHPDGNYPPVMIERIGRRSLAEGFQKSRLPEFTDEEVEFIKGTHDYFALNFYTARLTLPLEAPISYPSYATDIGITLATDPDWEESVADWLYVVPFGLRKTLNWIDRNYGHPEIVITENGYASETGDLNDERRVHYYREYLSSVLEAIHEDNVTVIAYTAWSLMDNFEWLDGYTRKFGLYSVDFDDPNRPRTMKSSGEYYRKVISTRCVSEACQNKSSNNLGINEIVVLFSMCIMVLINN